MAGKVLLNSVDAPDRPLGLLLLTAPRFPRADELDLEGSSYPILNPKHATFALDINVSAS